MTNKEIEEYQKKLQEIIDRPKQPDGNPAKGTKGDLQELAKKVGASTRAVYTGEGGKQLGYDAGISDLIDNIHTALQTAAMIDACRTASRNFWIAIVAAIIATLIALAAWVAIMVNVLIAALTR